MKSISFQVVSANVEFASVNSFCNFNESGPCDMCWGDLSL